MESPHVLYGNLSIPRMRNHYEPICINASYDVHFINVCAFPIRCTKFSLAILYYTLVVLLIQCQCGVMHCVVQITCTNCCAIIVKVVMLDQCSKTCSSE